jgi:cyanophycinase
MRPAIKLLKRLLHAALTVSVPLGAAATPSSAPTAAPAAPGPAAASGPAAALASAPVAAAPKGSLVIIGGALKPDNAEVWQRIVQLAGGQGARIAVLPSAAADPALVGGYIVERLREYGAAPFLVPLAVKYPQHDYRHTAEDSQIAQDIRTAGGVYFVGGDQARITQALVREDGSRSAVLEAVWDMYRNGGVVAGSSAGAAIMSSTMFYAPPPSVFATMRGGFTEGREIAPGLGFIGDDVFVDQHFLARGRFARMIPAMLSKGYKFGLGIDENTAMVVDAGRRVEIVGHKGALLIDLRRATTDTGSGGFNVSNAVISYLDRGDSYDLVGHTFTPSAAKAGGRIRPRQDLLAGPVFSPDILGKYALVQLMENLINNRRSEAIGIATSGPGADLPEQIFQFTLSKTRDSVGYYIAVPASYSILNLRLDIRPLRGQVRHSDTSSTLAGG